MSRTVTIRSLPQAFAIIKKMENQEYEWGDDYRRAGRAAVAALLEGEMATALYRHLAEMTRRGASNRRNGSYPSEIATT